MFDGLPDQIQKLAREAFALFKEDPSHPSLRLHKLKDTKKGRHQKDSFSVSISLRYRAIYVEDSGVNVWYWIGSHTDYDSFVGR